MTFSSRIDILLGLDQPPTGGDCQATRPVAGSQTLRVLSVPAHLSPQASRNTVVGLQSGDAACRQAWTLLCDISRREFQRVYDRLGVALEERGESFYNDMIPSTIDLLAGAGLVSKDDGADVVRLEHFTKPLVVRKRDGELRQSTRKPRPFCIHGGGSAGPGRKSVSTSIRYFCVRIRRRNTASVILQPVDLTWRSV